MRMQILRDHLEHGGNPPPVSPDADVIVLAGDLAPVRTNCIGEVMRTWRYPDLLDAARREVARQWRDCGVELLAPDGVDVGDVRFEPGRAGDPVAVRRRSWSAERCGPISGSTPREQRIRVASSVRLLGDGDPPVKMADRSKELEKVGISVEAGGMRRT